MLKRMGAGPVARRVLVVDEALAVSTSARARSVHALVAELHARNVEVVESVSCEDGIATSCPIPVSTACC